MDHNRESKSEVELPNGSWEQEAQAFKASLREYSTEEIEHGLEEELDVAAETMIEVHVAGIESTQEERRKSAVCYGVVALAQYGWSERVDHNPFKPPAWIDNFAQADLARRTEGDDRRREAVLRSWYFSRNEGVRRSLGEAVTASIVPYGDYNYYEFAAGVASKRIVAKSI